MCAEEQEYSSFFARVERLDLTYRRAETNPSRSKTALQSIVSIIPHPINIWNRTRLADKGAKSWVRTEMAEYGSYSFIRYDLLGILYR
jgi:hypothetical protein